MAINELRKVVVHEIGELKEGQSAKGEWKLRPFVVEETTTSNAGKTFSDFLEITAWNKAVEVLETLQVGDNVDLAYACSSRKQKTKDGAEYWRTGARLINMTVLEQATPQSNQQDAEGPWAPTPAAPPAGGDSDLPFTQGFR